ncbi:uncharacterized protein LOC9637881 [Selaginella moellendorffii]|uniref:uncharacterized protein LOC9637881 n=1 Tax=Selaginella moellendorffii TaxID=88036 RepID=UPI000D1C24E1|nr:uncharacterized protein LOC9637881 [Selaginella moellendorffii]|eukprot:XP_024535854.1 uncharacterized protein LOC9637881 [Selaginella moellendorffii]
MHGSGSPLGSGPGRFVEWEETFVSNDRGSRVVHYYLKDRQGQATLAVVGTERSVRHMVYVVCDDFLPLAGLDKSTTAAFKWRARREVVDWLSSLLSKSRTSSPCRSNSHVSVETAATEDSPDGGKRLHDSKKSVTNVFWVGSSWTCRKRLKHYKSFRRNGITIAVKSFVFVMSEENEHHIAYIEDMYEDKKLRKKLRVRWFHKTSELACKIPAPPPHPREVFFTQFPQVISVECVDGLATVLAPEHFEKCPLFLPDSRELIHVCSRQFDNDGIKPLNICGVEGYWEQKALAALGVSSSRGSPDLASDDDEDEENRGGRGPRLTRYRRRRVDKGHSNSSTPTTDGEGNGLSDVDPTRASFEVGDKVEILCQDSGLRGCWFIGVIVGKTSRRVRVRYDDLQDDDGKENLEEWVSTSKVAQLDKLNIRAHSRPALRPCPATGPEAVACSFGTPVDVWWNDGWWEGVVIGRVTANEVRVYFPDEGDAEVFKTSDLRVSRDWVNSQWCNVKADPEAVSALGIVCGSRGPLTVSQSCRYQNRYEEGNIDRMISIVEAAEELREEEDNADKFLTRCSSDDSSRKRKAGGGSGEEEEACGGDGGGGSGGLKCKHSKEASVEESDCELDMEQEGWNNVNKKPRIASSAAATNASIRSPSLKSSSAMFGSPLPPVASLVLSR